MGLFSKFKEYNQNRQQRRIEKSVTTLRNPKAIREDRQAAIDFFCSLDDPHQAVPALLKRFDFSIENSITDTREKEKCMDGIGRFGAEAIPHVREHLLASDRIAWPIKILKKLGQESEVIQILKDAIDFGDVAFDQSKVDKNYDILCYLVEYKLPGWTDKLAHFLSDPDERVRFAATECLIEQDDAAVPGYLERFLGDASPDNTRIRQSVIQAWLKRGWQVSNPAAFPDGRVVGPVFVDPSGKLFVKK